MVVLQLVGFSRAGTLAAKNWTLVLACLIALGLTGQQQVIAQVEAGAAATVDPQARYTEISKRWADLDAELTRISDQYRMTTDRAEREKLRTKHQELVAESEQVLPQLSKAAEAVFQAAPNTNMEVTNMLIGLVAFEYRRDNYDEAQRMVNLLLAGKCEDPTLLGIAGSIAFRLNNFDTAERFFAIANKAGKLDPETRGEMDDLPKRKELWLSELAIRKNEEEKNNLPRVKIETSKGTIVVELYEDQAPQAVANFVSLVEKKFYDGTPFHRVLPNFMAQGGDPTGTGTGGPGYTIFCECEKPEHRNHFRGTLSMAHAGKDTGGSQFFLTFKATPNLDGRHTAFGRVIEGIEVLAKIQRRDPNAARPPAPDTIVKAEVVRKREHAYLPTKSGSKN